MIQFFPSRTVFIEAMGFSIHWYGVMYVCAFLIALYLLPKLQDLRRLSLHKDEWASLLSWAIIGVIAGGRLGFVILYEPQYFFEHPLEIAAVWNGGMSSHGGFIGVLLCLLYTARRLKVPLLELADILTVPIALGLACGRIGNFINLELYGTVTDVPWALSIEHIEGLRHPTQIYALLKNLSIAAVCFVLLKRLVTPGYVFAVFLILYGVLRAVVEVFRDQPYGYIEITGVTLTRGQIFSIPLILAGLILWIYVRRSSRRFDGVDQ